MESAELDDACLGDYFSELPEPMVPHHADFVRAALGWETDADPSDR